MVNSQWSMVNSQWNCQQHPYLGRDGRVPGTREHVIAGTPFVVAYRVHKDQIQILAVLHASRRWPEAFEGPR